MKSIEDRWSDFRQRVISPLAPPVQVSEMRLAFYAGFKAMLDAEIEISNTESEAAGIALFESLFREAENFPRRRNEEH